MAEQIKQLIIDPIHVDELSYNDIHVYHLTDNASAAITLPDGTVLNVPKSGATFDVSRNNLFSGHQLSDNKLWIYDRQPNHPRYGNDCYFTVNCQPIKSKNGVAKLHFSQSGPAIVFNLCNSF